MKNDRVMMKPVIWARWAAAAALAMAALCPKQRCDSSRTYSR